MRYDNLFYQLTSEDVPRLAPAMALADTLATWPSELDADHFERRTGEPAYDELRREIEALPDTDAFLRREGQEFLSLVARKRGKVAPKHDGAAPYSIHEGHVHFRDPERTAALKRHVDALFDYESQLLGDFIYPPGGFRTWHTNKFNLPQPTVWVLFFVQASAPGASYFRFVHPQTGRLVTAWDTTSCVNIFSVTLDPLLWHCVGANAATRWSQGFSLPDDWQQRLGI